MRISTDVAGVVDIAVREHPDVGIMPPLRLDRHAAGAVADVGSLSRWSDSAGDGGQQRRATGRDDAS
jgi:hypothetical protein